jgi:hypothetical protein
MDKEKFEKMMEMMKDCCHGKGDMADCCSMMRKMMRCGEGEEAGKKKKMPGKKNKENDKELS